MTIQTLATPIVKSIFHSEKPVFNKFLKVIGFKSITFHFLFRFGV